MADRYGRLDPRDRDDRDRYASDRSVRERDLEREDRRLRGEDPLEDYGQADFSRDYRYDPETRTGYRVDPKEDARRHYEDPAIEDPARFAKRPALFILDVGGA